MIVIAYILGVILVGSLTILAALLITEGAMRLYEWANRRR